MMRGSVMSAKYVEWFEDIGIEDIPLVGGKNASLGEMIKHLTSKGVNVPNGFAITSKGYRYLIEESGTMDSIREVLSDLDTHNMKNLRERGEKVRKLIFETKFPKDLEKEIIDHYKEMSKKFGYEKNPDVAVRSSATAEDLPDASFAGQQETYLNVRGDKALIESCRRCFASLFTDRAISYREDKGFDHFDVYLSIGVQKMIRSDASSSGVLFSIDTESGFDNAVFITGSYGLGENIVQGAVNPDEYYVFKPTIETHRPIISKKLGTKSIKMVYGEGDNPVKNVKVPEEERFKYVINDDEILQLGRWAVIIENHYKKPMDIEWAKDGDGTNVGTGKLFIVQARPETIHSRKDVNIIKSYILKETSDVLVEGLSVGEKISQGVVNNIHSPEDIEHFKKGQVLVTNMTDPDWEPIMKIASAIVTNKGGRTCHAAIVSRELGIAAVIGTENATEALESGQEVTVSCIDETGKVYDGLLDFDVQETNLDSIPKTRTKVMMNAGIPEQAFSHGQMPNDGVGLAREEFIINSYIGIHPLALLNYNELKEKAKTDKESMMTRGNFS